MPYPSQINETVILDTAQAMIQHKGIDHFSLNKLAGELGVKTPSLYRYYKNKTELLRAVNTDTIRKLFSALQIGLEADGDTLHKLITSARAYRQFALENPVMYDLAFTNTIPDIMPDESERLEPVLPFQALMADLCGDVDSLPALRGLLAIMHGFVALELAGQFRRGGDLSDAYDKSVHAYLQGWSQSE